ncbi:putative NAD-dependent malic enzyme 4 [Halolactibacillus miurensis]|uniref:Malate dehydrogenase (Oxaloacetate-decarboxylating) n=1 Tax=Halolactibacillus miurensis TaxID=306541 RepID=A0A1I6U9C0_9BACI|nr:malic enzyme-like NAD(P)-binding protein [Halolactibacillus miurensis]GEM05033.1 putative NAD-dependent malic enzyme 4 [Halolactibacillus miurensis]SFS97867.1 malate dehydrogenase (oxaloacetate-decarboxylating) [Halolactibacillus miurensis]
MTLKEEALQMHEDNQGKLTVQSKVIIKDKHDLSLAYSPGVAEPCLEIERDENAAYKYTMKSNMVGVVTNGTAVLGLGAIGAQASLPVMEGKAVLFKNFADVDAFPICLDTTDPDEVIRTVELLAPTFGGINLEDIKAPECFYIEQTLKERLNVPVFHDDQHGTAIVTLAGLVNALRLVDKSFDEIKVVINGAGAAGIAIVKLLHYFGVKDMILCDSKGAIYEGREVGMNAEKEAILAYTNKSNETGDLRSVMKDADVFIGVSLKDLVDEAMVESMKRDPIIFAMANPDPEITPERAKQAGARVIGTGRSDYPNQVNNVLAFPGIFKGALSVRATDINEEMKVAAVHAIAEIISESDLHEDYVIPDPFNKQVAEAVAQAVSEAAIKSGVSQGEHLDQD